MCAFHMPHEAIAFGLKTILQLTHLKLPCKTVFLLPETFPHDLQSASGILYHQYINSHIPFLNAMSSNHSSGRVFLSTRVPAPTTANPSNRDQRPTAPSPPRSQSFVPPPSPPTSLPPSPPITPLTPHNTFDFGEPDGSSTDEGFVYEVDFRPEHASELGLSDLEEPALSRSMVESQILDLESDEDGAKDDRPVDTRSEPAPDTSNSSDNTVIHRPIGHLQRSNSVPPRPLKSALATPTPPSKTPDSDRCSRKKARFNEELSFRDISARPAPVRRCTSPDRADLMRRILQRDSFSEHAQSFYTDPSVREDNELSTAIELFEEVVEELVQVAEEHAEAHEQLANVAHEVADAIFSRRQSRDEQDHVKEDQQAESDDEDCRNEPLGFPALVRQTTADEDVDESCMQDPAIDLSLDEDERSQLEIAVWADRAELDSPRLVPIVEEPNSSTETIPEPEIDVIEISNKRRASDSHTNLLHLANEHVARRRNSMTDFTKLKARVRSLIGSPKAGPAACAVTVCSVRAAEPPKVNPVYEHPGARYQMLDSDRRPTKMAQTVRSDAGTFQVLWIEPPAVSSCSSDVSLLNSSGNPPELIISNGEEIHIARTPSPMDKVKTKLAAWSWLREQGLESERGGPNWIPLLSCQDDSSHSPSGMHSPPSDEPFAPPNTERQSGASSAKHSAPHSPGPIEPDASVGEDEEEDHPLELKVKSTPAKPISTLPPSLRKNQGDYLSIPIHSSRRKSGSEDSPLPIRPISREFSNLPIEETHFKAHKNSLVLLHKRKEEGKMNQHLMNARDSVVLTRSKLRPQTPVGNVDSKATWKSSGTLSPILDAASSDACMDPEMGRREEKARLTLDGEAHPDEHAGCPTCETERPRWFEANCKKGHFV